MASGLGCRRRALLQSGRWATIPFAKSAAAYRQSAGVPQEKNSSKHWRIAASFCCSILYGRRWFGALSNRSFTQQARQRFSHQRGRGRRRGAGVAAPVAVERRGDRRHARDERQAGGCARVQLQEVRPQRLEVHDAQLPAGSWELGGVGSTRTLMLVVGRDATAQLIRIRHSLHQSLQALRSRMQKHFTNTGHDGLHDDLQGVVSCARTALPTSWPPDRTPAGGPHRSSRRMAEAKSPAAACSAARPHFCSQRAGGATPDVGAANGTEAPAAGFGASASAGSSRS